MNTFWWLGALFIAMAWVFIVPRLAWSRRRDPQLIEVEQQLASLQSAYSDGHIKKKAYHERRQALEHKLQTLGQASPSSNHRAPMTAIALTILLPATTIGLYLWQGTPEAFHYPNGQFPTEAPDIEVVIERLKDKLEESPEDANNWYLLGQSYGAIGNYQQAAAAYEKVNELAPNEPTILFSLADATFQASPDDSTAPVEALLQQVLALDAGNANARMFLAALLLRQERAAEALTHLTSLQSQIDPNSAEGQQIAQFIQGARSQLGPGEQQAQPAIVARQSGDGGQADGAEGLTVAVSLAQTLADQVEPNDTLFIFARASQGPRMPLAVQRLAAGQLPLTIKLDDSMAMSPAMNLSAFTQVVVEARISKSGNASPQPGDLQAVSKPVSNKEAEPIELLIDTVL